MRFEYARRFEKSLRRFPVHERLQVADAIDQIREYLETQHAPAGLGLKKLFSRADLGAVFEARVSLALRLLLTVSEEAVTFVLVGDHEDVRRFIRAFQ